MFPLMRNFLISTQEDHQISQTDGWVARWKMACCAAKNWETKLGWVKAPTILLECLWSKLEVAWWQVIENSKKMRLQMGLQWVETDCDEMTTKKSKCILSKQWCRCHSKHWVTASDTEQSKRNFETPKEKNYPKRFASEHTIIDQKQHERAAFV